MTVAGMLLAAGESRRLGTPKQLLIDVDGIPLVRRAAELLRQAGCDPLVVVVGAHHERVATALHGLDVQVVHNAQWAAGMGASIAAGMSAVPATHGVLIAPCDMPAVTVAHLTALRTVFASHGGDRRVASAYAPDRADAGANPRVIGIPAILPARDRAALQALHGDRGARDLLRTPETRTIPLEGGAHDLDTPADVQRWQHAGAPRELRPDGP